ncbi:hypothetical protein PT974_02915 [Cladobotryum mycophilum]|uniref:Uncharacterized protein n=1 Tax=Cladobotryum mycophilum TaxID=491253 RepID=A0ABR0SZM2_9HYPO
MVTNSASKGPLCFLNSSSDKKLRLKILNINWRFQMQEANSLLRKSRGTPGILLILNIRPIPLRESPLSHTGCRKKRSVVGGKMSAKPDQKAWVVSIQSVE